MKTSWKIDPAHTDVAFATKHMMVTTVRGKFDRVEGELRLDETDPQSAEGEIRVATASLSTGFDARDQHLRSADFFDAETYPWIVARVQRVEPRGDGFSVTADVTIRDVTRPITFAAELNGIVPGMHGGRHAGFHLTGTVEPRGLGPRAGTSPSRRAAGSSDRNVRLDIDVAANEVAGAADLPVRAVA